MHAFSQSTNPTNCRFLGIKLNFFFSAIRCQMHKIRFRSPTAECSIACHTSNAERKTKRNCISANPGWETSSKANTVYVQNWQMNPVNRLHLIFFSYLQKRWSFSVDYVVWCTMHVLCCIWCLRGQQQKKITSIFTANTRRHPTVCERLQRKKTAYATNADLKIRKLSLLVLLWRVYVRHRSRPHSYSESPVVQLSARNSFCFWWTKAHSFVFPAGERKTSFIIIWI